MPNRTLRDWTDSRAIFDAGEAAENLFCRLIMKADDHGRYTAEIPLLLRFCYPLRSDLSESDIVGRLQSLDAAGLVACYEVCAAGDSKWVSGMDLVHARYDGCKRILVIPNFRQGSRRRKSKFPSPPLGSPPVIRASARLHNDAIEADHDIRTDASGVRLFAAIPTNLNTPEFLLAWESLVARRKAHHWSTRADWANTQLERFSQWGVGRAVAAIKHTLEQNYQGVFEPRMQAVDEVKREAKQFAAEVMEKIKAKR